MKVVTVIILAVLLMIPFSACSLSDGFTQAGTGEEDTALDSSVQIGSEDIPQDDFGAEVPDTDIPSGETEASVKSVRVTLFFAGENDTLGEEERDVQMVDGAILRACINALIEGPVTQSLRKTIPEGTAIKGISLRDQVATVDFSSEFEQAEGEDGDIARMSVVNTLTRINGVEKVRFRVEGEEMLGPDGLPLGEIEPASFEADALAGTE